MKERFLCNSCRSFWKGDLAEFPWGRVVRLMDAKARPLRQAGGSRPFLWQDSEISWQDTADVNAALHRRTKSMAFMTVTDAPRQQFGRMLQFLTHPLSGRPTTIRRSMVHPCDVPEPQELAEFVKECDEGHYGFTPILTSPVGLARSSIAFLLGLKYASNKLIAFTCSRQPVPRECIEDRHLRVPANPIEQRGR